MLKITIANEEVLCSNDFTINKEMLNTPSVILNNVYPKTWELNKDYTTNFYYPNDYERCLITDDTYYPYEEGITVEGTSFTLTNVDSTKESELMSVKGQTTQNGTPTPTTPVPINVVSGRQDVSVIGSNLLPQDKYIATQTINGIVYTNNGDGTFNLVGTATANTTIQIIPIGNISLEANQPYYLYSSQAYNGTTFNMSIPMTDNGSTKFLLANGTYTPTSTPTNVRLQFYIGNGQTVNATNVKLMLVKGNTAPTSYEPYTGNTYEINLGKNLLINTATSQTINGITYTVNEDKSVTANGTATAHSVLNLYGNLTLQAGTYMFSGCPSGGSWATYSMGFGSYNDSGNGATFTKTESYVGQPYIRIGNGTTVNNLTFKPMIEKGNTKTTYAPYKTPIELCKIGNYQDRIYKTSGKNLANIENIQINRQWTGGYNSNRASILNIPIEPNTQYSIVGSWLNSHITQVRAVSFVNVGDSVPTGVFSGTFTSPQTDNYVSIEVIGDTGLTSAMLNGLQILFCKGTATMENYEPYGSGTWYLTKYVGKVVLNGSESWSNDGGTAGTNYRHNITVANLHIPTPLGTTGNSLSNYFKTSTVGYNNQKWGDFYLSSTWLVMLDQDAEYNSTANFKTWLSTHNTTVYYVLATPTTTEITDTELISQLESIGLLNGLNNIGISTPYLPFIMTLRYNHQEEHTDSDLIFCGVVKNSGQISLNPRQPHYSTLQILDYKTFLSEGELDTFVISNKTVLEAIQMIISDISQYGFELGTVSIQNENDIIGAYSTKDKSAYDVFNYIADITQSRWTTRVLDKGRIAIDFYDPSLMEQGTTIDYTQTWFKNNNIIDMSFNYGTWDYRNKQVMTSQEVYGSITQNQIINYDGYATQIMTEFPIGQINAIYVNGVGRLFSTNEEKNIGLTADFYYSPGDNFFQRNMSIGAGSQIIISYIPIVEGRQIVTNASEISRVATASGVKGIVSRYENRNDATTSDELQKIGQSYIKYKGEPEITLTVKTESNLWEIGQRVQFNAPIEELDTEYMVKKKAINYVVTANKIFYTYELSSSFNSESAINYFDNQRAKANGNIKKGQYVSRNVDLEEEAQIIFYDTTATTTSITGNNVLQSNLETILGG